MKTEQKSLQEIIEEMISEPTRNAMEAEMLEERRDALRGAYLYEERQAWKAKRRHH